MHLTDTGTPTSGGVRGRAARRSALAFLVAGLASTGALLATVTSVASAATPAADCQPFSGTPCLLPYPSNLFTESSASGLRVHMPAAAMPVNTHGVRVGVGQYDRNDGFSPGSAMIVHVPGLDNAAAFKKTGAATVLNEELSLNKGQPISVIDETTGQRQLIFSQLDANAPSAADTNLMILPGKEFTDGHTYVVALRNLKTASGKVIPAPSWFEKLRDNKSLPANEQSQQARYKKIFKALTKAGIQRNSNLYEAWDFTVASRVNLTGRLLAIRNNAFAQLGDHNLADGKVEGHAPAFSVTSTSSFSPEIEKVLGTFQVPCYLIHCGPSAESGFHYSSTNPNATPTQVPGNMATAKFECMVPTSATPGDPARVALYGHGLLGDMSEVEDSWVTDLVSNDNMAFCATNWWGLADPDTALAAKSAGNLNLFSILVDRLQQGVLNTLFLGRLLASPTGFAANPDFESSGQPVIDTSHVFYYGDSQGGIEGGLATAVAPDWTRAVLGVTGIDYGNLLIQRSSDFTPFKAILESGYPDQSLYPVITDLMQQLWDRGDPDGYAAYMTSHPLPDTPAHKVLMQLAYGDFQVSMYAGAAEARTIGASAVDPALDADRARDKHLLDGIPAITHYPFNGSAVEIWDSGPGRVQPPPEGNIPPTSASNNIDPHEDPRKTPIAQTQISDFLEPNGAVVNVCGGTPCHTSVFTP